MNQPITEAGAAFWVSIRLSMLRSDIIKSEVITLDFRLCNKADTRKVDENTKHNDMEPDNAAAENLLSFRRSES
jgi:hypothetical protein